MWYDVRFLSRVFLWKLDLCTIYAGVAQPILGVGTWPPWPCHFCHKGCVRTGEMEWDVVMSSSCNHGISWIVTWQDGIDVEFMWNLLTITMWCKMSPGHGPIGVTSDTSKTCAAVARGSRWFFHLRGVARRLPFEGMAGATPRNASKLFSEKVR